MIPSCSAVTPWETVDLDSGTAGMRTDMDSMDWDRRKKNQSGRWELINPWKFEPSILFELDVSSDLRNRNFLFLVGLEGCGLGLLSCSGGTHLSFTEDWIALEFALPWLDWSEEYSLSWIGAVWNWANFHHGVQIRSVRERDYDSVDRMNKIWGNYQQATSMASQGSPISFIF